MARAKRTDRTEARRRHREQAALAESTESLAADGSMNAAQKSQKPGSTTPPVQRASLRTAFSSAIHPVDLKGDLRSIGTVVTAWGFLAALGATIAVAVWFVVAYNGAMAAIPAGTATVEQITAIVNGNSLPYQLMSLVLTSPPPMFGALLIGFTAKRASWLGGLIYGTVSVALVAIVLQTAAGRIVTVDGKNPAVDIVTAVASLSPLGAALFASLAAWYRRFLERMNPNRAQRQEAARKAQGRGDMKPARR